MMSRHTWLAIAVVFLLPADLLAYQNLATKTNKRLNRVSLNEFRQVIRDDLVGIVENALVSMQMGRSPSGTMTVDEKITTSVEASVRTMTNTIQDTLRRFETRLMTIEHQLEGGQNAPMARSSRYQALCSESHERSLQQGVERITAILSSVTERVGEARDASSEAQQGVQRLNDRLPKVEDNIKKELEHSVTVMETGVKRQLQAMQLEAAAAAAARDTRVVPTQAVPQTTPATCDGDSLLSSFKRMESSLTWQMNKVENLLLAGAEGGAPPAGRHQIDREAAHQVEPLSRSPDSLKSCAELYDSGMRTSGLYTIRPGQVKVRVFCDMNSEGGGWTVFQQRGPHLKREDFFRDWEAYKTGFGDPEGEYWLGNQHLHELTSDGRPHVLRIDMLDWSGERTYVQYDNFSVADEEDKFRINLGAFSGDTGDSMTMDNRRQFSTADQDNDRLRYGNCARAHKAGWWFGACRRANLNGVAHNGAHEGPDGINWLDWKGPNYSIKATRMMVK
ncbi:angiopoietin-related protein 6-like [Amphibalanus amphitrite]|uniref:angiopoietin-related protein 6-like n=1 Tax=Amphibalanus amphitrite TaxID=1232801 RepID=UPI001C9210A0|nr:angiopoietin-related protein 6-like [Amphibalanus amphitrite]